MTSAPNDIDGSGQGLVPDVMRYSDDVNIDQLCSDILFIHNKFFLRQFLVNLLPTLRDPYFVVCETISTLKRKQNTSANAQIFGLLVAFKAHIYSPENANILCGISEDTHLRALEIFPVLLNQVYLASLFATCFQLHKSDQALIVYIITDFATRTQYKDACQMATECHIVELDLELFVIPLFIQGKWNIVEDYLKLLPSDKQITFISLLDRLCSGYAEVDQFLLDHKDIPSINRNNFKLKVLGKTTCRFLTLLDLPSCLCPNSIKAKSASYVRKLLHQRYTDKNMSYQTWCEFIEDEVNGDLALQQELITVLINRFNDFDEAARWVKKLGFDTSVLHCDLTEYDMNCLRAAMCNELSDVVDECTGHNGNTEVSEGDNGQYYEMSIPFANVSVISTVGEFSQFLNAVECNYNANEVPIGMDCEWKPGFNKGKETCVSLLQLAFPDAVYILDMLSLVEILYKEEWTRFKSVVMTKRNHVLLGFGFQSDISVLKATLPQFKDIFISHHILDLGRVFDKLLKGHDSLLPHKPVEGCGRGLADMVEACLGVKLKKSEQMSNWERRPLRDEQLQYAAADAYVLLDIYKFLSENGSAVIQELSSDCYCQDGRKLDKSSKKKYAYASLLGIEPAEDGAPGGSCSANDREEPIVSDRPPMAPKDLKVAADAMLLGLGKQLRMLGVDAFIVEDTADSQEKIIDVALKENRIVLTNGRPYDRIKGFLSPGQCFKVPNELSAVEQVALVLQHFNVTVSKHDVFSRCQACNGDKYIKIPCKYMRYMFDKTEQKLQNLESGVGLKQSSNHSDNISQSSVSERVGWKAFRGGLVNLSKRETDRNVKIQFDCLKKPLSHIEVDTFYVCAKCGKIYWEGLHFKRTCATWGRILETISQTSKSFYDMQEEGNSVFKTED